MGAPTKLVAAMPDLLTGIRQGLNYGDACALADITYKSFSRWRKRGQDALDALELARETNPDARIPPDEQMYVDFVKHLRKAEAEGKVLLANAVKRSATGAGTFKKTITVQHVKDGQVVAESSKEIVEEIPPDWRAAAWALERKGYDKPQISLDIGALLDHLDDDELERIAAGESVIDVIADKLSRPKPAAASNGATT